MMPELGDFAPYVLSAYAVTASLIVAVIWYVLARSARSRRVLDEAEGRRK